MKFTKKPVIIATVSALALSGTIFANSTYASDATKQLKAVYANIKVLYNNQQVTVADSQEPFMINGTTYVPLRVLGDAVGKKVTWNNTDKAVTIVDTETQVPQTTVDTLNAQIQNLQLQLNNATTQSSSKDATISQLQSQITSLNSQIKNLQNDLDNSNNSSSNVNTEMNNLQRTLNNRYGDYRGTGASIELTGNKNNVKISIKVNDNSWNDLSSSNRRTMLQSIVDDVFANSTFKDATVSGTIYTKSSSKLLGFTVNNSKSVVLESNVNMSSVQSDLNNNYGTYRGIKLKIELSNESNQEDVVFRVYANRSDWNSLTDYQTTSLLSSIAADIDAAYNNMGKKIYGFVYDSNNTSSILKRYN